MIKAILQPTIRWLTFIHTLTVKQKNFNPGWLVLTVDLTIKNKRIIRAKINN